MEKINTYKLEKGCEAKGKSTEEKGVVGNKE